jgi:hypothetical protein
LNTKPENLLREQIFSSWIQYMKAISEVINKPIPSIYYIRI